MQSNPLLNLEQLKDQTLGYLQMMNDCYGPTQENGMPYVRRVLQLGRFWSPAPLKEQPDKGLPRECYSNSWDMVTLESSRLTYCEGWAVADLVGMGAPYALTLPTLHGWVLDERGRVLEATWEVPGLVYIGIPVQRLWHMKTAVKFRFYNLAGDVNARGGIPNNPEDWIHPIVELGEELNWG